MEPRTPRTRRRGVAPIHDPQPGTTLGGGDITVFGRLAPGVSWLWWNPAGFARADVRRFRAKA